MKKRNVRIGRNMTVKEQNINLHGTRAVKTAVSVTLCAFIYLLIGRNPTFACIGAVFGLGSDLADSRLNGGNRLFGTIFGGLIGMTLFRIYLTAVPTGKLTALMLPLIFVGIVVLILVAYVFKWRGAVQPGGVMLCIVMFNQPVDSYITYSINRIIDTAIGVALSILIAYLLPKERIVRVFSRLGISSRKSNTQSEMNFKSPDMI